MDTNASYDRHCPRCKEKTAHVPKHQGFSAVAIRTLKIAVFFISFGMVYPHVFTEDDDIALKCTKCGA